MIGAHHLFPACRFSLPQLSHTHPLYPPPSERARLSPHRGDPLAGRYRLRVKRGRVKADRSHQMDVANAHSNQQPPPMTISPS